MKRSLKPRLKLYQCIIMFQIEKHQKIFLKNTFDNILFIKSEKH